MCRASFEELVLDEAGGLRWNRLENLMEESSKSVDYDPAQLWLLAGTLYSISRPTAYHIYASHISLSCFPVCKLTQASGTPVECKLEI